MTGDRFIDFARKLLVQYANDPAGIRSIVSRLYYGLYHIALNYLREMGYHPGGNENAHQYIQRRFQNADEQNALLLGDLLVQLHERRTQADYKLDIARYESSLFGEEAVVRIDRALRAFEKCCDEPARSNIKAGISSYHRKINAPH